MLAGGQESDEDKFKNCDRLMFSCPTCGKQIIMDNVFTGAVSVMTVVAHLYQYYVNF